MSGKESTGYVPPPYVDQDDAQPSSKESNQAYRDTVIDPVHTRE